MVISHVELYTAYKVECSGGIRLGKNDRVVLITAEESVYQDKLSKDKSRCEFRGQGLKGNQSWANTRNSRLRDKLLRGDSVPLFEKIDENQYENLGEYILSGEIHTEIEPDEDGQDRIVFVFPLIKKLI